jgi:hypothetical protein
MKNICIFAPLSFSGRTVVLSLMMGIFCAHTSYGVPTPCLYCNGTGRSPFGDLAAGSSAPFFLYYKLDSFSSMLSRNVLSPDGQNTPKRDRHTHDTGTSTATLSLQVSNPYSIVCFADLVREVQRVYDVEKDAKNSLFAFILSRGLLEEYKEFMRVPCDDYHKSCLTHLFSKKDETKK